MTGLLLVKTTPLISFDWTLLMVFITFFVLFLIMKKFFFEKIHKFMEERELKVRTSFENADAVNATAEKNLNEYKKKLKGVEAERRVILTDAKNSATENSREIVSAAERRAAEIITQAQQEIEREKERALADMHQQVAMLSLFAAEKIIEKNLSARDQQAIIDNAIKEASESKWKI
jgi:F-type H+-transporting ATPase subunit b